MCPRRRVEIGQDYLTAQRKSYLFSPTNEWCLAAPSVIKLEEREFVVDSGASMHMQSSQDLEIVRVSESPTMVVTANGEVHTKEEATVYLKELDLFVTVSFSKIHLPFSHSENSAKITDISTSGPVVRNHNTLKMAHEYNAARRTSYRSLSLVYRQALQAQRHLHLRHQYRRKQ